MGRIKKSIEGYAQERIFHAAWEGLHFDRKQLCTTQDQAIKIHHPGHLNHDQGPDFLHADIQIAQHRHHGHVELHLDGDDWARHGHHLDPHYDPVVLHVFLRRGKKAALRTDGSEIPELDLGDRLYLAPTIRPRTHLACDGLGHLHLPRDIPHWLEECGRLRIQEKSKSIGLALEVNKQDWAQLLWEEVSAILGGPVNGANFRQLARQVPWSLVRKYSFSRQAMESLLFGGCGMLEGRSMDAYHTSLQEEWRFLQLKHQLHCVPIPFKFHRMHPAGFPPVRIAQIAGLLFRYRSILQLLSIGEIQRFLGKDEPAMSDYWATRYEFGNTLNSRRSEIGRDTKARLVTNVLVPFFVEFARAHLAEPDLEAALDVLRGLPSEENRITRRLGSIQIFAKSALQSQGIIWLHRELCTPNRCLECPIGQKALARSPVISGVGLPSVLHPADRIHS